MSGMDRYGGTTDPRQPLYDRFEDERPSGKVVGTPATSGVMRGGVDAEELMCIDNGALRLRPLAKPGWGREGVSYGPVRRKGGLAFAAHALNGHNASQTYYQKQGPQARLRGWLSDVRRGRFRRPHHYESLAVGLFPSVAPCDPTSAGNGFVMHAATADNGELWAAVGGRPLRVARGIQNLQIYYVVVLRQSGAAYYVASIEGSVGLGVYPSMRPVAIDHRSTDAEVYGGIHQRILGEVGYRVDTRVYGVRIEEVPELGRWFGGAALADRMTGSGLLESVMPEVGGPWRRLDGTVLRSASGAQAGAGGGEALVDTETDVGLVHVLVDIGGSGGSAGIVWRASMNGADGAWSFTVGDQGVELARRKGGSWVAVESSGRWRAKRGRRHAIQVADDGASVGLYLDGELVFDRWIMEAGGSSVVGVRARGAAVVHDFEAHGRAVPIPAQLDLGPPWQPPPAQRVFVEHFQDAATDLDGLPVGGDPTRRWERVVGSGVIETTGSHARVKADREHPNPGRTVYTVPWHSQALADLTLEMVPPGTRSGEGHACRGGVVLWQDPDNYLVVNIFRDDTFDGASISSFYHLDGKEDMYDAVWTLVQGVHEGQPCTLRVAFDGMRFLAYLNGEPCLYRALTDVYPHAEVLSIERVGIIVNWEWGDDTGTTFLKFEAAGAERPTTSPV